MNWPHDIIVGFFDVAIFFTLCFVFFIVVQVSCRYLVMKDFVYAAALTQMRSKKYVFLQNSKNIQESTCAE